MSNAMDFLHRADQVPETSASPEVAVDSCTASTNCKTSDCLTVADLDTRPHSRSRELQGNEDRAAVDNQDINDEMNAEKLADLLNSFTFKETTEATENACGSILENFLALLAEHTDLPPELEDVKDSCVKRGRIIDEEDDESGKIEASQKADSETTPILIHTNKQGSKSQASRTSAKESTQLQPEAPAFVPTEHKLLPFTGQFNEPNADGLKGVWPPVEHNVLAVPVTYMVWMPVQQAATNHSAGQANVIKVPAKQMQGLSASMWAARPPGSA
ncbi:hypothetical protein E4U54_004777 [Claviceps lovelessii]|nr:hypothetical protein E4U54_004777 [Claviceps lovelessii]